MEYLVSNSSKMMERSLDYLWTKQAAILDNIANAETPNYKAKVITFEESFRNRLEKAAKLASYPGSRHTALKKAVGRVIDHTTYRVTQHEEATRMDENGVNITEQSTEMIRNAYQLQYTMKAISGDFARLRTAING